MVKCGIVSSFPDRVYRKGTESVREGELYFDVKHDEVKPFIVEVEKDTRFRCSGQNLIFVHMASLPGRQLW